MAEKLFWADDGGGVWVCRRDPYLGLHGREVVVRGEGLFDDPASLRALIRELEFAVTWLGSGVGS